MMFVIAALMIAMFLFMLGLWWYLERADRHQKKLEISRRMLQANESLTDGLALAEKLADQRELDEEIEVTLGISSSLERTESSRHGTEASAPVSETNGFTHNRIYAGKVICELEHLAEGGDPEAQFELGFRIHSDGNDNQEAAIAWYEMAARQGHDVAMNNLGKLYLHVYADFAKARHWLSQSADRGNLDALYSLAGMYADGLGGPVDMATAARMYHSGAVRDHGMSQFSLGTMYLNGVGVDRDRNEARRWLRGAVTHGISEARDLLEKHGL